MIIKVEDMFFCANCPFECSNKRQFTEHEKIHFQGKFLCETCSKIFFNEKSLTAHKRTHTDERPFICTYCSKSFTLKSTLNQHEREQHGEETLQLPCTECDKSFKRKKNLEIHQKTIHEGIKRFRKANTTKPMKTKEFPPEFKREAIERVKEVGLEEVSKALMLHRATLKSWMLVTGSYSCNFCTKSFRFKSHLKNHQKLHLRNHNTMSIVKPVKVFKEKRFSSDFKQTVSDYAKKHTSKLASEKFGLSVFTVYSFLKLGTFSCHLCKRQCSYKKQLEKHLLDVHKVEGDLKYDKAITMSGLKEEDEDKEVDISTEPFTTDVFYHNENEKKLTTKGHR